MTASMKMARLMVHHVPTGNKRDWPKMKQGFKDIVASFPVNWNYNRADAWGGDSRLLPLCRNWAASTG